MFHFLREGKDYIFVFIMTLLFAYVIGLTIIAIINKRLTDISIKVPTPQVNIQWPKNVPHPAPEELREEFRLNPSPNLNYNNDDLRGFIAQKEYHDCTEEIDQIQREKREQMNSVCLFNHDHKKYQCQYGRTNYIHPEELDPFNRRLFQYNYFPNMTLQDYINWLWLYAQEPGKLCYEHYRNLEKVKKGQPLHYQPGVCPPKLTADGSFSSNGPGNYFQNMMKQLGL